METLKDYQNNIKEAVTFFHSISDKKDELITICLENHLKAQIKSFQKQEEIIHKDLTTINAKPLDINTFLKDKTIDFANELKKKQEAQKAAAKKQREQAQAKRDNTKKAINDEVGFWKSLFSKK